MTGSPTVLSAAQTARTLLCGHRSAGIGTAFGSATVPVLHAALETGEVVVLLSRRQLEQADLGQLGGGADRDRVVVLDIRSFAPLPDVTLIRAHVTAAGWARVATPDERSAGLIALVRAQGLDDVAAAEVISGWATHLTLIVEPAECEVHLPEGCHRLDIDDVLIAEPDPLAAQEGSTIERLNSAYAEQLLAMVRRAGCGHGGEHGGAASDPELGRSTSIRAVGVDRHGVTLHCRLDDGEESFGRLPFPAPVETPAQALSTVGELIRRHQRCCHTSN